VKINIPHMLIGLRELQHHVPAGSGHKAAGKRPVDHRGSGLAYWLSKEVLRRPWLYRLSLRLARWFLRPQAREGWLQQDARSGSGLDADHAISPRRQSVLSATAGASCRNSRCLR